MKKIYIFLIIVFSYFYFLFMYKDIYLIHFKRHFKCNYQDEVELNSEITKIHDPKGILISEGTSTKTTLRFDRRLLNPESYSFSYNLFRLKEHENFEFFAENRLFQIGLQ